MVGRNLIVTLAIVTALFLGALAFAPPASAATAHIGFDHNGGVLNINPGPATIVEGASAPIPIVAVSAPAGLGAWDINVDFDGTVLDATACTSTPPANTVCNPDCTLGADVCTAGANIAGIGGTVNLATMTIEAIGEKGQCSDLDVIVEELVDPSSAPVTAAITNGRVCIVGCADFTGDGFVGILDGIRLLLNIRLGGDNLTMDLNADGDVDGRDFLIWRRQAGTSC